MELNEKLQELRKQKGLTQEELAAGLYVSRTAVSKWESGRGYPSIDSLKALARFFGVTIDDLLSGDELLTIAEEDTRHKQAHLFDLVFGLLDLSAAMFFFLPFFGQKAEGVIQEVTLWALNSIAPWLKALYLAMVIAIAVTGLLTLALEGCHHPLWAQNKRKLSLSLNALGALLFIASLQPYAASFLFIFLIIKAIMLLKRP